MSIIGMSRKRQKYRHPGGYSTISPAAMSKLVGRPSRYARFRGGKAALNRRTGGFIGQELKFYDTSQVGESMVAPTDAAGGEHDPTTVEDISSPAQGDTEESRDGKKIVITSAFVNGSIKSAHAVNQTVMDDGSQWVVYMVQDTQSNGATLDSEKVFHNQAANAATAASPLRNLQYSSRFKVLAKATGYMESRAMAWDGTNIEIAGLVQPFVLSWKGKMEVNFQAGATAAGVASCLDNSIHIIAYCSNTDLAPNINYNARVRFYG